MATLNTGIDDGSVQRWRQGTLRWGPWIPNGFVERIQKVGKLKWEKNYNLMVTN